MSYLLYIPGVRGAGFPEFQTLGLGDTLDGSLPTVTSAQPGPDGGTGVFCAWGTLLDQPTLQYLPERQEWRAARPDKEHGLAAGRYWVGREKGRAILPATLYRGQNYPSQSVTLADGQVWDIPVARQLPHCWGLNEEGEFARRPRGEFAAFCQRSEAIFRELVSGGGEVTLSDSFAYGCAALALNYRLTADLIDFLGLIDDTTAAPLLGATIELEVIRKVEDEKKNTAAADTPAT